MKKIHLRYCIQQEIPKWVEPQGSNPIVQVGSTMVQDTAGSALLPSQVVTVNQQHYAKVYTESFQSAGTSLIFTYPTT